jgi:hypothetical protein
MKYLKTYEDIVTFDLNDNEKKELISMAIERGNINILKSLLDNVYQIILMIFNQLLLYNII